MLLIPFEKKVLQTSLPSYEISERLRAHLRPPLSYKEMFVWGQPVPQEGQYFVGKIKDNRFEIYLFRYNWQPFLPRIKGEINGSLVAVEMKTHLAATVFMLVFLGIFGAAFIHGWTRGTSYEDIFGPGLMFLFFYLLWVMPFKIEARIVQKKLKEIWQAGNALPKS